MSDLRRRAIALILVVVAGVLAACAEPVAPIAQRGATESAVLAQRSKGAVVAPFAIEAATIETRDWDHTPWYNPCGGYACWNPGFPGKVDPVGTFNALPRSSAGYTNRPVALTTLTCAAMTPGTPSSAAQYADCINNPGDGTTASHSHIAMRYRLLIHASTDLAIRFGVDFMGGALLVDGTIAASNWEDPAWWGFFDTDVAPCSLTRCDRPIWVSDPWGTIVARVAAGVHEVVVIGFENGADYGTGVQIAGADSVWREVTSKNIKRTLSLSTIEAGRITGAGGSGCAGSCTALLGWGSMPALTAVPDPYFAFVAWGGACAATPNAPVCEPLMDTDQGVSATFRRVQWPLQVSPIGTGQGTVTSTDNVINCGSTCLAGFAIGSSIVLTATANANSDFTGWNGAGCTGIGTCTVTMNDAQSVTASFALKRFPLNVSTTAGTGAVTSSPSGINCGTFCASDFDYGTTVTLTAAPATGFSFVGWGGACGGTTPTCTVTMNSARTVTATFAVQRFALTVATTGTGTGTVTSSVGGINCGATCSATLEYGTDVRLTAIAGSGSSFAGWSGACAGTGSCVVTMTAARTVTATFNLPLPPVSSCEATPSVLWPADHKMVAITIKPLAGFTLRSVTSSEPDDAPDGGAPGNDAAGDGATRNDVQGWVLEQASFSGMLRAERDGRGTGRTYSFVYANGAATATCTVTVPHDKR